ncbi:MAG: hypothetical protein ACQESB_01845 [Elusimicrobiota bacterium]
MRGLNEFKIKVNELIKQHLVLKKENAKYKEENFRLKKDIEYFENRAGEVPDIAQKNRKLLEERKKIAKKVDGIIAKLNEIEK